MFRHLKHLVLSKTGTFAKSHLCRCVSGVLTGRSLVVVLGQVEANVASSPKTRKCIHTAGRLELFRKGVPIGPGGPGAA